MAQKNYETIVPLKYLSNFGRTFAISLIDCEINLILTWSATSVIPSKTAADQATTFAITDTKLYFPVLALSTEDNTKLLQQLKSNLKTQLTGININQK